MDERTKLMAFLAVISGAILDKMEAENEYWETFIKANDYAWMNRNKEECQPVEFYKAIKEAERILGF